MNQKKLQFSRVVSPSPEVIYQYWTDADLLKTWFVPKPWSTEECEADPRPGGAFNTVMKDPEGKTFPSKGCYLDVVINRKVVFTDAFSAGFVPNDKAFFVGTVTFEKTEQGTLYTAMVEHWTEEDCREHAKMGFPGGWEAALDQLLEQIEVTRS